MDNAWELDTRQGWIIGLVLVAFLLAITIGAIVYATVIPLSILTFLLAVLALGSLGMAIRLMYQLYGLASAGYEMDRNGIWIHWGGIQHQIPMSAVTDVYSAEDLDAVEMRPGIRWPGYFVGIGKTEKIDTLLFYATAPQLAQVVIRTEGVAYAISPEDVQGFLTAMRERLEMGPTLDVEEVSTHPVFFDWEIWQDRWGMVMLLGSASLLLILVGVMCWRYPALPMEIAMRFSPEGATLLVANKARLFYLALLGLVFFIINGGMGIAFYRRERAASYFIWSGLLAALAFLWAAVISILANQV